MSAPILVWLYILGIKGKIKGTIDLCINCKNE